MTVTVHTTLLYIRAHLQTINPQTAPRLVRSHAWGCTSILPASLVFDRPFVDVVKQGVQREIAAQGILLGSPYRRLWNAAIRPDRDVTRMRTATEGGVVVRCALCIVAAPALQCLLAQMRTEKWANLNTTKQNTWYNTILSSRLLYSRG